MSRFDCGPEYSVSGYVDGEKAARQGMQVWQNPYAKNQTPWDFIGWHAGWCAGMQEMHMEAQVAKKDAYR